MREFFQNVLENHEIRLESYEHNKSLTEDEQNQFKKYIIDRLMEDGDYPGIYTGEIYCEKNSVTVFASRSGFSWSSYSTDLLGIFNNVEEGNKELFNIESGILY